MSARLKMATLSGPAELAVERVQSARQAVADLDYPFTPSARTLPYPYGQTHAFNESVERLNCFTEAAAECLYAPVIRDAGSIGRLVGLAGTPITLAQPPALAARRIGIDDSLTANGGSYAITTVYPVRCIFTHAHAG